MKAKQEKILAVFDGNGIEHVLMGDSFVRTAILDALEKLKELEAAANKCTCGACEPSTVN